MTGSVRLLSNAFLIFPSWAFKSAWRMALDQLAGEGSGKLMGTTVPRSYMPHAVCLEGFRTLIVNVRFHLDDCISYFLGVRMKCISFSSWVSMGVEKRKR